jgi:hypothetical protein
VPGLDALAGILLLKSTYFSLPLSSIMVTVIGKRDLNAVTVALSYRLAVNVVFPILSFILMPAGFVLLVSACEVYLLQDAQPISDTAQSASVNRCFTITVLNFNK